MSDDLAFLGFQIETGSVDAAAGKLTKLTAASAETERATKTLAAATEARGAASRRASQYDEAHAQGVRNVAMASDTMAAAQRRAAMDITATTGAMSAAARQAAGFANLARQGMVDAARAQSRSLMASVEASTTSIKAMYAGTATAATVAANTIVAANAKVAASTRAVGYMGTPGQVGLNAQQRVMLGYQLQDVFTSIASGMNPMMVAAQQGPQISMLYGGFRNMLGAIPKPLLVGAGAVAGVGGGLFGLNAAAEAQDARLLQDRRFSGLFGTGTDGAGTMRDISTMASSVSIGVDQATESIERFAKATRGLGASRQDIIGIAAEVEKLAKLGGANDNEAGAAREGIAAMLKSATVSADQLKTVLSNVPGIAKEIAAGLGVSVTQLRLMADEGDLTNRTVLDAMLQRSAAVNAEFAAMPRSVGDLFSSIGTDLGVALKNLADSIPLVNQYRNALELAAKAAKGLKEAGKPESNESIIARTNNLFDIPGTGNTAEAQAAQMAGRMKAMEERAQALRNLHAQMRLDEQATADAAKRAADETVVNAATVARKFDELGATYRQNQRDVEAMEKALDVLQAGLTNLSAEEAANQVGILTGALERAREAAQNVDPALRSLNDINRRNDFRANDNTPAGMALQGRVRELTQAGSNPQDAATAALAEQQEKIADIIKAKQEEAAASDKITAAMGRGKKALIEAQVEAAVLAFIMANVGQNTEIAADQIQAFRDAVKTIFTNESIQGGINAAKPLQDELAGIAAAMKVVEQGAYAMKRAEAEARAARDENGTGGLQMEVFDARQRLTDETMLAGLREEIELTNKLAAAAGDVAEQKRLQLEFDIKRAQQGADPANAAKVAAEMQAKAAADARLQWANTTAEMEDQNVILEAQLRLMGQAPEIIAKEIALIKMKQEVEKRGKDITQEEINRRTTAVETGERLKAQAEELRRANELWTAPLKSALESIQQTAADAFDSMLESGKFTFESLAQTFTRILRRMAAEFLALATVRPVMSVLVNAVSPSLASQMGMGGASFPGGSLFGGSSGTSSMGGGGLFGGGGFLGGIGDFLNTPFTGPYAGMSPSSMAGVPMLSPSMMNPSSWGITPLQGLGAAAGAGMGIYQLMNSKSTSGTIGGISSILGAGVSLIPGIGQIAGPAIALLGNLLPGLFGMDSKPTITNQAYGQVSYGANGFGTSGGAWGPNADMNSLTGPLGQVGTTMQGILNAFGGVKEAGKVWGVALESMSQGNGDWQFDGQSSFLVGPGGQRRQWGMGSTPGDIGMETAGVAATLNSILGGAVGEISANMRKALEQVNQSGKDTFQTLSTVVAEVMSFDEALKGLSKSTSGVEEALAQVDAQFAGLYDTASKFGFATGQIDLAKQAERLKIATSFADSIQRGINDFTDPTINKLADLDKWRTDAITTNADILKNITGALDQINNIEELYALQRKEIVEEGAKQTNAALSASLDDLIRSLRPGGALANVDPRTQLAGLQATYQATYAQAAAGDQAALARFSSDASAYAQFGQSFYGGSTDYNRIRDSIARDALSLQGSLGSGMTTPANMNNAAATTGHIQQLMAVVDQQAKQITQLMAELSRTNGLLQRYIANAA